MAKEAKNKKENNKHFWKDFKAELKKVIWPTPKQLVNNTIAVITIVLITAVIVFVLDIVFEKMNTYKSDIGIEKWVKTHSKNKIGIVEKGDYVNGMEVDEFDDEEGNIYLGFPIYTDACMDCIEEVRPLSSIEIEDIVTHEQFESVKYNF